MEKQIRKNFFMMDNDFIDLYGKYVGVYSVAVYATLSKYADGKTRRCWPSMATIAEKIQISRRTVSKALNKLEEWNIINITCAIDRKLRKRKNNVYQLVPLEFWRALPKEEECDDDLPFFMNDEKSHGTENAIDVASSVP